MSATSSAISRNSSINRIRLEFKGRQPRQCQTHPSSINRIRLEFKALRRSSFCLHPLPVLIESDWNLKLPVQIPHTHQPHRINRIRLEFKEETGNNPVHPGRVLIESDWNLKYKIPEKIEFNYEVLIESDWNLK